METNPERTEQFSDDGMILSKRTLRYAELINIKAATGRSKEFSNRLRFSGWYKLRASRSLQALMWRIAREPCDVTL